MKISASRLRQDIYGILDKVIETNVPVEIERRGHTLRIVPAEEKPKLSRLKRREFLLCDPEELVHIDWSSEWRP